MNCTIVKTGTSRRGRLEELDDQKQSPGVSESLYSEDKREREMADRQDWVENLHHHLPGRLVTTLPARRQECQTLSPRPLIAHTHRSLVLALEASHSLLISQVAPTSPSAPCSVCLPAFGFLWPMVTSLLASSWMQLPFYKVPPFSQ